LNKSAANLDVAKKENSSILLESNYTTQYDGFDPNSPEANIIFSLFQNAYLDQSLEFASKIQKQFTERAGRGSRGVKQAGFLVLYKTTMPGVLIETGFISNPAEEAFLASESGQSVIASAIYRAFKQYKDMVDGNHGADQDSGNEEPQVQDTPPKDTVVVHSDNPVKPDSVAQEIFFRVQFATSSKQKSLNSPDFKALADIRMYQQNNIYKYTSGNFTTLEDAVKQQAEVQSKGFKDAFVVAFLNEQRISPSEAVKLLSQQKK
jgi:N-acetylmuramoyl-L-alanine amidase